MQISGFSFIKNGLTLGYPIKESVQSIEPLCDEIIINVGFNDQALSSDDGTYDYLRDNLTGPKYKFLKSWWDPAIQKDGLILSQQTNIALEKCQGKYCQYIQGDEAVHEEDLIHIENGVKEMETRADIEGLIFNYFHFYGNVDIYKWTRNIYRREVRLIRNGLGIQSWKDAQGFKHQDLSKINAKQIQARIFHYGWARSQQIMAKKVKSFDKLYHGDKKMDNDNFTYQREWGLKKFTNTHPKVVKDWIEKNRNDIDILGLDYKMQFKDLRLMISDIIENLTGYRMGEYKNFIEVK